jgi:hypothetical protein
VLAGGELGRSSWRYLRGGEEESGEGGPPARPIRPSPKTAPSPLEVRRVACDFHSHNAGLYLLPPRGSSYGLQVHGGMEGHALCCSTCNGDPPAYRWVSEYSQLA